MGDVINIDTDELRDIQPEYNPFNPELDEKFPLDKMFRQDIIKECAEGIDDMSWINQLKNSPANNAEAEILMGQFITLASRAGQWIDMPQRPDEDKSESINFGEFSVSLEGLRYEFTAGKNILSKIGFITLVTDDDGKEMLKPQEPMLRFLSERLVRYAPKSKDSTNK